MSVGRMIFALLVMATITASLHGYIWARLVRDAAWGPPWGRILTGTVLALAILVPVAFVGMRWLPRALNAPLAWGAYVWLGLLLYLFLLTA